MECAACIRFFHLERCNRLSPDKRRFVLTAKGTHESCLHRKAGTSRKHSLWRFEKPVIRPSQALVKVAAVAVGPIDTYIRSGAYSTRMTFPFIIGRIIVSGAGTSGSVVAGRLPANPQVQVLLLEAGDSDKLELVMDPNLWVRALGGELDGTRST
jgi:hypothetical protein